MAAPASLLTAAEAVLAAAALTHRFPSERRLEKALDVCLANLYDAAKMERQRPALAIPYSAYVEGMAAGVAKVAQAAQRGGPGPMRALQRTLSDALARADMGRWDLGPHWLSSRQEETADGDAHGGVEL